MNMHYDASRLTPPSASSSVKVGNQDMPQDWGVTDEEFAIFSKHMRKKSQEQARELKQ